MSKSSQGRKTSRAGSRPLATAPAESDAVIIFRICEQHRTRRHYATIGGVVAALAVIAWATVKILDKPMWALIAETIGGTVAVIFCGQYGFFRYLMMRFKRYTVLNQGRVGELEQERDPQRSSSQLLRDGTNPPEDML